MAKSLSLAAVLAVASLNAYALQTVEPAEGHKPS